MALGDVLRVLSDERRRRLMHVLKENEKDEFDYDELTGEMLEEGYLDLGEKERFKVELFHSHLPMMDEVDIVDLEEEEDLVRYTGEGYVEEIFESVRKYDERI